MSSRLLRLLREWLVTRLAQTPSTYTLGRLGNLSKTSWNACKTWRLTQGGAQSEPATSGGSAAKTFAPNGTERAGPSKP